MFTSYSCVYILLIASAICVSREVPWPSVVRRIANRIRFDKPLSVLRSSFSTSYRCASFSVRELRKSLLNKVSVLNYLFASSPCGVGTDFGYAFFVLTMVVLTLGRSTLRASKGLLVGISSSRMIRGSSPKAAWEAYWGFWPVWLFTDPVSLICESLWIP